MEIHNLFTDFAHSIVDGIETVTLLIGVDQLDYIDPPQPNMQTYENHRTTIEHIQDNSDCSLQGMSKKRRMTSEDIQSNDKVGNEINASVPISLLEDEIVFSEEDFKHMDESVEKSRCRGQKRPAKFAEYIAENKIKDMSKNFDTKLARLNMATQLYKFACEKPYLNISG
ncbi:Uncharacterized protein Fot_05071 [Forsythia ovata]|uniref:Uncharacterized protein n=1 Tax=Forsythia ovata TaxID=205694 RepID=A0ABD1WP45_9LAMI